MWYEIEKTFLTPEQFDSTHEYADGNSKTKKKI